MRETPPTPPVVRVSFDLTAQVEKIQKQRLRPILILAAIFLLLSTTACDNINSIDDIIAIVPKSTATPASAPTPTLVPTPVVQNPLPVHIAAPKIALDAPVIEMGWQVVQQGEQLVSEWLMPENDAAWHRNSATPGSGSNVVISGHNASTGGHVFADLDGLEPGDEVTLTNAHRDTFSYVVAEKTIVRTIAASAETERFLQNVTQPTTTEQLTLITCWPSWSNTHRLVVVAHPHQTTSQ